MSVVQIDLGTVRVDQTRQYYTHSRVDMRAFPESDPPWVDVALSGHTVYVTGLDEGWLQVEDPSGAVSETYLLKGVAYPISAVKIRPWRRGGDARCDDVSLTFMRCLP